MHIIIADSQEMYSEGLKAVLQKHGKHSIVQVSTFEALRFQIQATKTDFVIIDFDNCKGFLLTEIPQLLQYWNTTKMLIISNNDIEENIVVCLENNIDGYLLKACSKEEFIEAFDGICQDKKMYCQPVLKVLCNQYINIKQKKNEPEQVNLTSQETKITELTSWGLTAKEIADKLNISIHTVNTHRKNIFKKIGVKNSSELVMYAIKRGIIDSTEYYI